MNDKEVVRFELDGMDVYVEAERLPGRERVALSEDKTVDGGKFTAALERVKPAAEAVVRAFRAFNEPDELALEFALKFSVKVGSFLFASDQEATFKLTLTWKNERPPA